MSYPLGYDRNMHETPCLYRWDDGRSEPLFGDSHPAAPQFEVDLDGCRLFSICESVADSIIRESLHQDDPEVIRRGLESMIRQKFELPADRAAGLFDLALEQLNLRVNGHYHRSIAEVGRLIALVSGTELAPENN